MILYFFIEEVLTNMKINRLRKVKIAGVDEKTALTLQYDNRGEPYREGLTLELEEGLKFTSVMLDGREAYKLYTELGKFLNVDS